jgi:uncharacterized membrane protein HdeD (DUF308 family)
MTATAPEPFLETTKRSGGILIAVGAISVIAGIVTLVYPGITLLALALIAGLNLLILGALGIAQAFIGSGDTPARVLRVVLGLLGVIAGIVVMRRPGESLLAVIVILGVWFVASGIVDAIRGLAEPEDRGFNLLTAVADIVLGVLILALPELSLKTLAVLVGIAFVLRGLITVVTGFLLRRAARAAA